jgi:hypothetical protein
MNKTTEAFEAWWADTGEQYLYALNTTTDDDIKTIAGIAWESAIREALADHVEQNLTMVAEPVKQEPRFPIHTSYCPKCKHRVTCVFGDAPNSSCVWRCPSCKTEWPFEANETLADLRQQNAALKAVIDAWNNVEPDNEIVWDASAPIVVDYVMPVQPVQEPLYELEVREFADGFFGRKKSLGHNLRPLLKSGTELPIGSYKLYAAPVDMPQAEPTSVDAKAIRAETLEEAAKVCETEAKDWEQAYLWDEEFAVKKCAAAIRGLK